MGYPASRHHGGSPSVGSLAISAPISTCQWPRKKVHFYHGLLAVVEAEQVTLSALAIELGLHSTLITGALPGPPA
jgi:hypothetical protein